MRRLSMMGAGILVCLFLLGSKSAAQNPTQESLDLKKQRLSTLGTTLDACKKKSSDIEAQIKALADEQELLKKSIEDQETESKELRVEIPIEEEKLEFLNAPARKVLAVKTAETYLIDFNGERRLVKLHGLYLDPLKRGAITKSLKKRLVKKSIYFRCADDSCGEGYLYFSKSGASLNARFIEIGFAVPSDDSKYDAAAFLENSTHWSGVASESRSEGATRPQ